MLTFLVDVKRGLPLFQFPTKLRRNKMYVQYKIKVIWENIFTDASKSLDCIVTTALVVGSKLG